MLYVVNNLIDYYEKFNTETLIKRNEKLIEKNIDTILRRDMFSIKDERWMLNNKIIIHLNHNLAAISIVLNRRGL